MISLVAGTLGPSCAKNLPLEDPLVPIHVSLSSRDGMMDSGHMTFASRGGVSCCRRCPDRACALHQPELSLHHAAGARVSEAPRLSLLSLARGWGSASSDNHAGLRNEWVQGRPVAFLLVEDRAFPLTEMMVLSSRSSLLRVCICHLLHSGLNSGHSELLFS